MKIFICLLIPIYLTAQVEDEYSPCDDPILDLARNEGIKSIPLKDMFHYFKISRDCQASGGEEIMKQIRHSDWERDYKKSKVLASYSSTYSTCVAVLVFYFYFGKIFGPKTD